MYSLLLLSYERGLQQRLSGPATWFAATSDPLFAQKRTPQQRQEQHHKEKLMLEIERCTSRAEVNLPSYYKSLVGSPRLQDLFKIIARS